MKIKMIQAPYAARHSILDVAFFACYYFLLKKTCYLWRVSFQTKLQTCNFITKNNSFNSYFPLFLDLYQAGIDLFKVNNGDNKQNNVWDLLKIKNKNTGAMSPTPLSFLLAWDIFHSLFWCFLSLVVAFEWVNASWKQTAISNLKNFHQKHLRWNSFLVSQT